MVSLKSSKIRRLPRPPHGTPDPLVSDDAGPTRAILGMSAAARRAVIRGTDLSRKIGLCDSQTGDFGLLCRDAIYQAAPCQPPDNCDHALFEGHFRRPAIRTAIDGTPMAVYRSHPMWQVVTTEEVVARLEEAWARHGAFESEAHSVTVSDGRVLFDFVTWWDSGNYCTGRIEIEPTADALGDEPPSVRLL
jgi:hypothetical protein